MVLTQPTTETAYTDYVASFHTTMVLTQQLLLQKLYTIGGGKVKSIEFLCWEDIQSKDKGVLGF